MWRVDRVDGEIPAGTPSDSILHVTPIDDLRAHDCNGEKCWCHPSVEELPKGYLVVHNSMDEREKFETGERKPS